jgi:FG-GAP-like repeat
MRVGVVVQGILVALSGVVTAAALVKFIFIKQPDLSAGASPEAVAAADLDGDGNVDLAVANFDSDDVSIFWGNGDGSFTAASATLPVGTALIEAPVALAIADINGDGKPDIVTANEFGNTVSVLLNLGQRQFSAAIETPTGNGPEDLVVADFDGDKMLDVATPDTTDDTVTVLLGKNDGTFAALSVCSSQSGQVCRTNCSAGGTCNPGPVFVGTEPDALAAGDFNKDGKIDLVVANSGDGPNIAGSLMVLEGVGNGMFAVQPEIYSATFDNPVRIAAADLNNDGNPDLVVVNETGDSLSVLMGKGDLTFQDASVLDPGPGSMPEAVVVADFNGDHIPDIACSASLQDKVCVFAGSGNGTFAAPQNFALVALATPSGLAAADFNKDRKVDVATANMTDSGTVSVLMNASPGGCAGDCSGDGTVTVDEILTMVNIAIGNAAVSKCFAGDTNGDQQITVDEILAAVGSALNGCGV